MEILSLIIEDGFCTAGIIALLVLSYKVYKCKIHSDGESSCVKCFRLHFVTESPGGEDIENILT